MKHLKRLYGTYSVARHGFWFVDIPRTSSSSIRYELGKQFGKAYAKENRVEKEFSQEQIFRDHRTAQEMSDKLGRLIWNRIFTFTMVRNPWDRTHSMYNFRKKVDTIPQEWSFREYVLALKNREPAELFKYRGHYLGSADYVLGNNGQVIVDFIAKYENREQDLKIISNRLNMDDLGDVFIQRASPKGTHYSQFYDDETREIVRSVFSRDVELFDYEFEEAS